MAGFQVQLEKFIEHFEEMQRCPDSEDMFNQEFMALKAQSQQLKELDKYTTDSGQQAVNKKKNRFKDILPFEYTRVVLPSLDGVEGSDYINANYIKGCDGAVTYIAAQGPLPNTVNDFVRMLWQNNTEIIIMACREVEMGKHKCHPYWPVLNEEVVFGEITIRTTKEENVSNDFVIRDLQVRHGSEDKMMRQYHYTAWPDHGVPTSAEPIIRMIEMARDCQTKAETPVVVHCSAGCGRTGTILAVDYMRSLLLNKSLPDNFSVYGLVEEMRTQRPAMVQAKDQYFFVYMACAELAKRVLGNKPQPPPKNGDTISLRRQPPPNFDNSAIYENTTGDQLSAKGESPPIIPRQNSVKSSSSSSPSSQPPTPPTRPSKSVKPSQPPTPSPSSTSLSDTPQPPSFTPSTGVYELASAPDSPVPKAAPRVKKSTTPVSLSQPERDTKPPPLPPSYDDGGRRPLSLPDRSSDAGPKSPGFKGVPTRKDTPRGTVEEKPQLPPMRNKSTPTKVEGKEETPKSAGKSILDTIMDICGTDVQAEVGIDEKEEGVKGPITFSMDATDGPSLPARTTDSMQLINQPPEPKGKQLPPPPTSSLNSIYEQPTLNSMPVSKIPPSPSGPSPPSTLSPSSSITGLGGSRSSLQAPPTVFPKTSRASKGDLDTSELVKPRPPLPALPNMSAGSASSSVVSAAPGSNGFGGRVGKPRGPRPPPSHWKAVPIVL